MAALGGIEKFGQAIGADREVGGDARRGGSGVRAVANREIAQAGGRGGLDLDGGDACCLRGFGF